jgi:hypothetical protein
MNQVHSGGTLGSLVVGAVARFGDRPAIADGNIRWSYREFGDAVGRFVSLFRSIGLCKGNAVSIGRRRPLRQPVPFDRPLQGQRRIDPVEQSRGILGCDFGRDGDGPALHAAASDGG